MSKNKICFFIGSMELGGIGKLSLHLMKYFISNNIEVDLILMKRGGEYFNAIPKGVKVYIYEGNYATRIIKFIRYLIYRQPSISFSARERQNIVNVCCCIIPFIRTEPIVSFHSIKPLEDMSQKKRLISFVAKLVYKRCKKIIAVSNVVKNEFSILYNIKPDKIKVIYNPAFNPNVLCNEEIKKSIRQRYGDNFFVYIGRLKEIKNIPLLINAFEKVIKVNNDFKLLILGEGPEKSKIQQLIKTKKLAHAIFLVGYVENPNNYIIESKGLVISSNSEGFGNVLVEAMGQGITVVSTDSGGPREILSNGDFGYLVPTRNADLLAVAMLKCINQPFDSDLLKQRARMFSVDSIAEQYHQFLFPLSL